MNLFNDIKSCYYIWKFFKKEKPDLVHLITIKPYLYGGIISYLTGVPALVSSITGLGSLFINKNLIFKFLRLLSYPIFKLAFMHSNQKVIFQNKDDIKVFVDWGVLKNSKAILIKGSGVSLEKFTILEEPNETPIVSFAGRLIKEKGVYEFINAAKILISQGIKVRFKLAGDLDPKNPSGFSLEYIKKLKKENLIEVLGFQKDISLLYSNSNIICLPSYREGLPKSLIEAAAASRAIVTTDVPGCRDAIIPNVTGLLVPVKNSQKLAEAIKWLIVHRDERIKMGKAGRKFAEKEFIIEKIVHRHLNIYQSLLKNNTINN